MAIIWVCGGCGSHFQNGRHEFSMSPISANNIDRKLIFVFLSLLSESQNPSMVNIFVCGVCGSHFQNGRHEFSMSQISANNIDRKLFIVSMSMFSKLRNPNVAIVLICGGCGSHFQNGRHEFSMSHISANNIDRKLFVVSLSLMSGPQHVKSAVLHLHRLLHPLVHPHLMAARHAVPAGGNVIHFIFHCALATSQVHPKSAGLGLCGALIVAWSHIWPASYHTLNTCWASGSASYVGGMFSISLTC